MLKSNTPKNLSPMRAGDRESRMGGVQYCLSPLPLPTDGEHAGDVAQLDARHDDVTMDLRQGASPEGLITAGHTLTSGFLFMLFLELLLLFFLTIRGSGHIYSFIVFFLLYILCFFSYLIRRFLLRILFLNAPLPYA